MKAELKARVEVCKELKTTADFALLQDLGEDRILTMKAMVVACETVADLSTALQEAEAENSTLGDRCIKQFEELQEQSDELNRLGAIIEEARGFAELTPQGRAEWQVENDELKARLQVAVEALNVLQNEWNEYDWMMLPPKASKAVKDALAKIKEMEGSDEG